MEKREEIGPKKSVAIMLFFAVILAIVLFLSQFSYKPVAESASQSILLTQFEVITDWNNGFRVIKFIIPHRTSEICVESKSGALSCLYGH